MCSGRKPMPTTRAGRVRSRGNFSRSRMASGVGIVSVESKIGSSRCSCIKTCNPCVRRAGRLRRCCTESRSDEQMAPQRSFSAKRFDAATASWLIGLKQIQFVHQFQSGRVDSIATKIAKEIRVLFKDKHFHPGTREQKTKHDPSGATAHD